MRERKHIPLPLLFILVVVCCTSCTKPRPNFQVAIIPPEPVNFAWVNSAYDDYNSDLPITHLESNFQLVFSSNRNSYGDDFDLVGFQCQAMFSEVYGSFEIWADPFSFTILDSVNSPQNEWGPYFTVDALEHMYSYYYEVNYDQPVDTAPRGFITSDRNGTMDLFCYDSGSPVEVATMNTEHDEGYLCLDDEASGNIETGYFTSDRYGSFDIFLATGEPGKLINESDTVFVERVEELSGPANDHCPYVRNNLMVFASDREGGFGGYDLWYSIRNGNGWSATENFGERINTSYDEFRPVITPTDTATYLNDLMIFSSDRPGGMGGFDLYYVGVDRR